MLITERVLDFVAPHECLGCGNEGNLVCQMCALDIFNDVPSRCYRCLRMTKDSIVCQKCRPNSSLKHVWVTTEYEDTAKELVRIFKFEHARSTYVPIAEQMAETLPYLRSETIITYIPTATTRYRTRGYDQSELIAKQVAKLKNVQYLPLLERFGQSRQVGATKKQRFEQAAEMFRLKSKEVPRADIIIVDDILTTGASLESAAKLLKRNGAKYVNAAVFAQKH